MEEKEKLNLILVEASKYIGVKESPFGSNNVEFNTEFYGREVHDGDKPGKTYQWCGTSQSIIYRRAGFPIGIVDYLKGFASCPFAIQHLDKWGTPVAYKDAKPGYLVFYDFKGNSIPQHVGMIKEIFLGGVLAYEGNTGHGNDCNGGKFMEMSRDKKFCKWIVRPKCLDYEKK